MSTNYGLTDEGRTLIKNSPVIGTYTDDSGLALRIWRHQANPRRLMLEIIQHRDVNGDFYTTVEFFDQAEGVSVDWIATV